MFRKILIRVLTAISMALLTGAASSLLAYFDPVTGKTWRNPAEVFNFSWNEIDAVCIHEGEGPMGTACSGSVSNGTSSVDLTGWTWGFQSEVDALFHHVILQNGGPAYPGTQYADNADWGLLSATALGITFDNADFVFTFGWTATSFSVTQAFIGDIIYERPTAVTQQLSQVGSNDVTPKDVHFGTGGWYYRDEPAGVPEPASLLLVSAGLVCLAAVRRRRKT